MNSRLTRSMSILVVALCAAAGPAAAAVTAEEAARLKADLTPFGAERAGNKEGTIPEWQGCSQLKAPAALQAGDRRWDPFPNEKPLFAITAANMDRYADKLSEGVRALLKKYPQTMRLDVYPTHRTHCAPDWVNENTFRNATRGKLVANASGDEDGVEGAYGGIPFPIPKHGAEVRWNHNLRWKGQGYEVKVRHMSWTVTGSKVLGSQTLSYEQNNFYLQDGSPEKHAAAGNPGWRYIQFTDAPPFRAGEGLLSRDPTSYINADRQAWQYLVGQRRVRRAPNIGWDTPDFIVSGANFFDEVFGGNGPLDRHEYKLIGKREMYIPYHNNRIFSLTEDQIFGKNHHNPDAIRWELHRVWVVEATLRQGKRHAVPKRVFYQDEDTWGTALFDGWDPGGALWRVSLNLFYLFPDMPGVMSGYSDILYVLDGVYSSRNTAFYSPGGQLKPFAPKPDAFYTPDALSGSGVR